MQSIGRTTIGDLDWGGIISSAISATSNVVSANQQYKAQQSAANSQIQLASLQLQQQQQANQYAQQTQWVPGVPNIVLIGGGALAAFLIFKAMKKR